jgi:hypothetical protein
MPKRGSDADSRIFFDELVSIAASRLKATGVVKLENQWALITVRRANQTRRRRPYRFQKRRLMVLFHMPEVRPEGQKALARRRCV